MSASAASKKKERENKKSDFKFGAEQQIRALLHIGDITTSVCACVRESFSSERERERESDAYYLKDL